MANNCVSCGATDGVDEINTSVPTCNGCKIKASPYATDPGVQPVCTVTYASKSMCSCNRPSSQCTCGNVAQAVPAPYYQCAPVCQEDHTKTIVNNNFAASLKGNNSWNVPSCGSAAIVTVVGLTQLQIGSNFFHPLYGYYQVIQFNSSTGQVTLQNNCVTGNAAIGSAIPAGTEFIVTPPPISSGGGQLPTVYPYLAVDFTAPANGACIVIIVTTTQGIAVNKNVQIGSGTYRVSAVTDGTHMTICNDGTGAVPGTAVIAKNAGGEYQYPIILIDTNPCTNTPVLSGALLVCKDGLSQPLDAATVGSIPVVIDAETNEVEFRQLSLPTASCSSIPCCLTLVAGIANYAIQVVDSSVFVVGDILQIGSRTDRFTISSIPNATTIVGTMSPTPDATTVIAVGTSICVIGCCEDLQNQIDDINEAILPCSIVDKYLEATPQGLWEGVTDNTIAESISNGVTTEGAIEYFDFTNTSECQTLSVQIHLLYEYEGALLTDNTRMDSSYVRYLGLYGFSTGTIAVPPANPGLIQAVNLYDGRATGAEAGAVVYASYFGAILPRTYNITIAPLGLVRLGLQAQAEVGSISGAASFVGDITRLQARFTSIAVPSL